MLTWVKKSGDDNQLWKFGKEGDIESVKTGLVLGVSADGTKV